MGPKPAFSLIDVDPCMLDVLIFLRIRGLPSPWSSEDCGAALKLLLESSLLPSMYKDWALRARCRGAPAPIRYESEPEKRGARLMISSPRQLKPDSRGDFARPVSF